LRRFIQKQIQVKVKLSSWEYQSTVCVHCALRTLQKLLATTVAKSQPSATYYHTVSVHTNNSCAKGKLPEIVKPCFSFGYYVGTKAKTFQQWTSNV